MTTANRRLSRKKEAMNIIEMQKITGAIGIALVFMRLNKIFDQFSRVMICITAKKDYNMLSNDAIP